MIELPKHILRLAELANRAATDFSLNPTEIECKAMAATLDVSKLRKVSFVGQIMPEGMQDWRLSGTFGATVIQPCVVSLTPVTTRIDEKVARRYLAQMPEIDGDEIEIPNDVSIEPLENTVDLYEILLEALSLALPAFPRADDAPEGNISITAPGASPMTDAQAKPFAGLGALKEALEKKGDKSE